MQEGKPRQPRRKTAKKASKKPIKKLLGLEPDDTVVDDTESADRDKVKLLEDGRVALTPELWRMASQLDKIRAEYSEVQNKQQVRARALDGLYNALMARTELECEELRKHDDDIVGFELLNNGFIKIIFKKEYIRTKLQETLRRIPPQVLEGLKGIGMSDQQILTLFNHPFLNSDDE